VRGGASILGLTARGASAEPRTFRLAVTFPFERLQLALPDVEEEALVEPKLDGNVLVVDADAVCLLAGKRAWEPGLTVEAFTPGEERFDPPTLVGRGKLEDGATVFAI
jgi:hypothetical protein